MQAFDAQYKSESSRVCSKIKQMLSNMFVDQLLALNQLPSIQDAGQPNPPHLIAHRSPFRALREPAPPFSASDPRFKYFPAWLAQKDATGDLKAAGGISQNS